MLTLAPQLTVEQRATVAIAMRSELAWAGTDAAALAAVNALTGLSPREPEPLARAVIEMLKYPAAAGPATDALLAVFREAAAARGGDVGGAPTLAWVRASFPGTDLDAPPGCPRPRHAGLTCPATATVR
jgi:hypothetical protein